MIDGLWVIIFYVTVNYLELQNLRQEKELADSEIASLELEKNAIRKVSSRVTIMVIRCRIVVTSLCQFFTCYYLLFQTIPKVLHELVSMREGIAAKQQELLIYDKAIQEIEKAYGHIIFSEEFYVDDENPNINY